mmetsp:Transcript_20709/g.70144  ORF Transcript_20709/g.70144 Transcript_20709/m.70144 type:complete len:248 (-) Transcript_20709:667-1410(-)
MLCRPSRASFRYTSTLSRDESSSAGRCRLLVAKKRSMTSASTTLPTAFWNLVLEVSSSSPGRGSTSPRCPRRQRAASPSFYERRTGGNTGDGLIRRGASLPAVYRRGPPTRATTGETTAPCGRRTAAGARGRRRRLRTRTRLGRDGPSKRLGRSPTLGRFREKSHSSTTRRPSPRPGRGASSPGSNRRRFPGTTRRRYPCSRQGTRPECPRTRLNPRRPCRQSRHRGGGRRGRRASESPARRAFRAK